ncbi:RNA-binding protein Vip1 [Aaosphaeria arxii CBS 175.79]|uniref:RNA-binding protein Vip1 n=1 Tax=Aaosphaeria arxii CBS 175.79 TaxID=1450172 RepID=A0A6A5Y487_9PLEO|nr:RNA-binding protein Vip1 [Aaosphaeria arxii CBS 175.79]KAF2019630.1 RNA-binding protein Vip1 [Aaosphaeria arxii CBS 175.79]
MSTTVHVEGISTKTSEDEIKSFFSFCGKIQNLSVTPTDSETQSATVTFEKAAAAKTALLLDNTQLGPNSVHVTSSKSIDELAGEKSASAEEAKDGDHHIEQEEKPRGRIVAEYLAHGYTISDKAIEKALALDQQHGVSNKFLNALNNFDQKTQATQKAQAVDTKLGVSSKFWGAWGGLTSYFDKAAETPTGQKLRTFYETGNKTVLDVHNEARHLADIKKKNQPATGATPTAEEAGLEKIPGTDKTQCNCAADTGKCACAPGQCACSGCAKATSTTAATST